MDKFMACVYETSLSALATSRTQPIFTTVSEICLRWRLFRQTGMSMFKDAMNRFAGSGGMSSRRYIVNGVDVRQPSEWVGGYQAVEKIDAELATLKQQAMKEVADHAVR